MSSLRPRRLAWLGALLLTGALAQSTQPPESTAPAEPAGPPVPGPRVAGNVRPWLGGDSGFSGLGPGGALRELYAGRAEVALLGLPGPVRPVGVGRTVTLPVGVYAVQVAYRLPGVNLRLDLPTTCRLLSGDLRTWDAPEVQALNPGTSLPALPVLVSARVAPNGPSWAVAQACVREGVWPPERLKASWSGGAAFARFGLASQQADLDLTGSLAVFGPGDRPPGAQLARLRAPGGAFVGPDATLGFSAAGLPEPISPLPARPFGSPLPVNVRGAYPLRGLVWAVALQEQAYRGRGPEQARALLGWLETLRATTRAGYAALPPAVRAPLRFYFGGQPLRAAAP